MLIHGCEVSGRGNVDVRLRAGRVQEIATQLEPEPGEPLLAADGGALLPGLHDHHIHLLALAAARHSIRCGPPEVRDARALARALEGALRNARSEEWLRGVGYHESVAGALDRHHLDPLVRERPLRIQHRSGALWMLNSAALRALDLERVSAGDPEGIEVDTQGRATGRLFRLDAWLRTRIERCTGRSRPSLSRLGCELASYGVTGVTDATPDETGSLARALESALRRGELRQRIRVMGALQASSDGQPGSRLERGPRKLLLDERSLPSLETLCASIRHAHRCGRPVALHCVTRSEIVLALGALRAVAEQTARDAGPLARGDGRARDRIEHASIAPPEIAQWITELEVTVVTQPHFIAERGDAYLAEVEPRDRRWLYRLRGLLEAGISLGGGSDAPFGHPDPWRSMRAAVERRSASGAPLGLDEAISPERALALFSSPPEDPGAPARQVAVGGVADLCLLDCSWAKARSPLSSDHVRATFREGEPIWQRTTWAQRDS